MLLLIKHLIMPFTLGAVVISTSLALSLLQVSNESVDFLLFFF
jgi:hypothetical protein